MVRSIPGKGVRFVRFDSQVFLFANSKCEKYFHNLFKPLKLTWTAMYRKQHGKDIAAGAIMKKCRTTKKPYSRSIVGATLEVIQKRRIEKSEVHDAAKSLHGRFITLKTSPSYPLSLYLGSITASAPSPKQAAVGQGE
ncbi:hypothetical protein PVL29_003526 [Vitis rotundifolia]|uniref:Large ribosomal subunit protein eL24-related N-terminal domain-containing protein n=1 Tax=Vitis rotundifolia TaxID=103349 RepID=A0AA39AFX8_VITRO|nr:hypothetical protein PVL29_003526 [Vitis rotundifolia]